MSFLTTLVGPVCLGAFLNLDKQVFGPFMINRPLVSGFLMGLALGEMKAGIWLGLSAELLWLATLPLGGQVIPNGGLAVTTALIAWAVSGLNSAGAFMGEVGLVVSFMSVPLWAKVFAMLDLASRALVPAQVAKARDAVTQKREPRLFRRNLQGLWVALGGGLILSAVAIPCNLLILAAIKLWAPAWLLVSLGLLFPIIPFLGLVAMAVFLQPKTMAYYLAGVMASLLALSAVVVQ